MIIGAIEEDILRALARFQYLSTDHLRRYRGAKAPKDTREAARRLERAKLVRSARFQFEGLFWWLTKAGAKTLGELDGAPPPPFPDKTYLSGKQIEHRKLLLDAMLELHLWAAATGQTHARWGTFFSREATHLKALARKPDGVAVLVGPDGVRRPYLLEAMRGEYSGGFEHNLKSVVGMIEPLLQQTVDALLQEGKSDGERWSAVRVLCVTDTSETRDRILKALRAQTVPADDRLWRQILFKDVDELGGFASGWHATYGDRLDLISGAVGTTALPSS